MEKGMTHLRCWLLGVLLLGGVGHAQDRTAAADASSPKLEKADKTKLSYAIGYQIGSQFADMSELVRWCRDSRKG